MKKLYFRLFIATLAIVCTLLSTNCQGRRDQAGTIDLANSALKKGDLENYFLQHNYALVYNIGSNSCSVCVIKTLERLNYFQKNGIKVFLVGKLKESYLSNTFLEVPEGIIKFDLGKAPPYLCIFDTSFNASRYFYPDPLKPELFEGYLKEIESMDK